MKTLFDNLEPHTHRSHPIQSYLAAERLNVTQAAQFALSAFKQYPGYTRTELAAIIGYRDAERACKRAKELEQMGLIRREHDKQTKEYRNWPDKM